MSKTCPKGKVVSPKGRCINIGGIAHLKYIENGDMESIEKAKPRASKTKIAPKKQKAKPRASKPKIAAPKKQKAIPKDMKEFLRTINIGFNDLSTEKQHQFHEQVLDDISDFIDNFGDDIFSEEIMLGFLVDNSSKYFPLFDILVHNRVEEKVMREMDWSLDNSEDAVLFISAVNKALKARKK